MFFFLFSYHGKLKELNIRILFCNMSNAEAITTNIVCIFTQISIYKS